MDIRIGNGLPADGSGTLLKRILENASSSGGSIEKEDRLE